MSAPGGAGTLQTIYLQLLHVLGAPASLIGSELSSLLGSDPSQIHTYEVDNEARQQALGLPLWQEEDNEEALFTLVRGR